MININVTYYITSACDINLYKTLKYIGLAFQCYMVYYIIGNLYNICYYMVYSELIVFIFKETLLI